MLGRIVGGAEDSLLLSWVIDSIPWPPRGPVPSGSTCDQIGRLQRDFLRDHAADREAEHIRLVQAKCSAEGHRVSAHLL